MAASSVRPRSKIASKSDSYFSNIDFKSFRRDLKIILINPEYSWVVGLFLLLLEIFVTTFVIIKIPCKLKPLIALKIHYYMLISKMLVYNKGIPPYIYYRMIDLSSYEKCLQF